MINSSRFIEELPVSGDQNIEDWLERFESIVEVNQVYISATGDDQKASRKRGLFLSVIGPEGYRILKAYMAPYARNLKIYDELMKCIQKNLVTKPSAISEAFKLSQIKQEISETMAFYMSRIKMSASRCEFGDAYDRMVRDKFICGLRNEELRATLLLY